MNKHKLYQFIVYCTDDIVTSITMWSKYGQGEVPVQVYDCKGNKITRQMTFKQLQKGMYNGYLEIR